MGNPVVVEVTRGSHVESRHRGAFVVCDAGGRVLANAGDAGEPVFPRSAIKVFQALPLVVTGAADAYGFTDAELALACASHGGEPAHVEGARRMLEKVGLNEADLECGAHWPTWPKASQELGHTQPNALHNNCSGKHTGMLALARHLGVPTSGYVDHGHEVQARMAEAIGSLCEYDIATAPWGVDGCSVPTWAVPLQHLALGFARCCTAGALADEEGAAARRLLSASAAHPHMVAGTRRFCTGIMKRVPRVYAKTGAEGVYCGCVPHLGLGIALKCGDGGTRAAECMMAHILECLPGFAEAETRTFHAFAHRPVRTRKGVEVGTIRPVMGPFEDIRTVAV